MLRGSCLCGDVAWQASGPLEWMHHCHCSLCRKAHGSAFGSYLMTPAEGFRLLRGEERVVAFASSKAVTRQFCGRCGTALPEADDGDGQIVLPVGPCDGDPGVRSEAHIFVASKAPWYEIRDALPRFDAFPPGIAAPVLAGPSAPRPPGRSAGKLRVRRRRLRGGGRDPARHELPLRPLSQGTRRGPRLEPLHERRRACASRAGRSG